MTRDRAKLPNIGSVTHLYSVPWPRRSVEERGREALAAAAEAADVAARTRPEVLVARAARGDAEALGCLYDRYVDSTFRYAWYRLGDQHVAEDVISRAWQAAAVQIRSYSWPPTSFGAWLISLVRAELLARGGNGDYAFAVPVTDVTPEHVGVFEAIGRLPVEVRECLALRYLHGLGANDTARVLAVPAATEASREAAGLAALRVEMQMVSA